MAVKRVEKNTTDILDELATLQQKIYEKGVRLDFNFLVMQDGCNCKGHCVSCNGVCQDCVGGGASKKAVM